MSVVVRKSSNELSALALKCLRESSKAASALTVQELGSRMANDTPFEVGCFAEYRAREIVAELERVGFTVLCGAENAS